MSGKWSEMQNPSEEPPLHIAENAERLELEERLVSVLHEMLAIRLPEADTEEQKIIAKTAESTPGPKPEDPDKEAERLAKRASKLAERKQERDVMDFMRQRGGGRSSGKR
jgi:uncharacterized membrane protein